MPVELTEASNGKIYGAGIYIFEYNPDIKAFNDIKKIPTVGFIGKLMEVSESTLLGMDFGEIAYQVGIEDRGKIFKLDLVNYAASEILTFDGTNGRHPDNSGLIKVNNLVNPVAVCSDMTLYMDGNGQAVLHPADIDNGSTGDRIQLSVSESNFNCDNIGENNVILTATDAAGNSSTCNAIVTVADTVSPEVVSHDIEVFLDAGGRVDIEAGDVDNGSSDACGIQAMELDVKSFTSVDMGENTIELTVTDNNGNSAASKAIVTVSDSIPPVANCIDIEIGLDEDGNAVIEAGKIDNSSSDASGIHAMNLDLTSFTCENIGENIVELVVTDNYGNSSSCKAVITVVDSIVPEISCVTNQAVYLNPYEDSFLPLNSEWAPEITDNCGIETTMYSINGGDPVILSSQGSFELEAGTYNINLLAADGAGNISSCTSVFSVEKRPANILILQNDVNLKQREIQMEAVLMDELIEEGIEGKKLVFVFNGYSETVITNENGTAAVAFPFDEVHSGTYSVAVNFDEDATYTGSSSETDLVTESGLISVSDVRAYPNPFSERLYIEFVSPKSADARIDIFDSAGRLVKTILNQSVEKGIFYKVEYIPNFESSGYFTYRINIDEVVYNGKILYKQ